LTVFNKSPHVRGAEDGVKMGYFSLHCAQEREDVTRHVKDLKKNHKKAIEIK